MRTLLDIYVYLAFKQWALCVFVLVTDLDSAGQLLSPFVWTPSICGEFDCHPVEHMLICVRLGCSLLPNVFHACCLICLIRLYTHVIVYVLRLIIRMFSCRSRHRLSNYVCVIKQCQDWLVYLPTTFLHLPFGWLNRVGQRWKMMYEA
jgi:hypothetical protein